MGFGFKPLLGFCILSLRNTHYTRGNQKVRGKELPFLHCLINRAGITAHNTATHMQL